MSVRFVRDVGGRFRVEEPGWGDPSDLAWAVPAAINCTFGPDKGKYMPTVNLESFGPFVKIKDGPDGTEIWQLGS